MNVTKLLNVGPLFAASALVLALGCEKRNDTTTTTTDKTKTTTEERPSVDDKTMKVDEEGNVDKMPKGGGPVLNAPVVSVALESIATARCDRENRCGNVGAGKKYKDTNSCITDVRADKVDDLNADECPAGYDKGELQECLAAIKDEDCKNPIDKLSRITACRASDICLEKQKDNK
jgi:hypothetical protein